MTDRTRTPATKTADAKRRKAVAVVMVLGSKDIARSFPDARKGLPPPKPCALQMGFMRPAV